LAFCKATVLELLKVVSEAACPAGGLLVQTLTVRQIRELSGLL
jgi:hypothetical protein